MNRFPGTIFCWRMAKNKFDIESLYDRCLETVTQLSISIEKEITNLPFKPNQPLGITFTVDRPGYTERFDDAKRGAIRGVPWSINGEIIFDGGHYLLFTVSGIDTPLETLLLGLTFIAYRPPISLVDPKQLQEHLEDPNRSTCGWELVSNRTTDFGFEIGLFFYLHCDDSIYEFEKSQPEAFRQPLTHKHYELLFKLALERIADPADYRQSLEQFVPNR